MCKTMPLRTDESKTRKSKWLLELRSSASQPAMCEMVGKGRASDRTVLVILKDCPEILRPQKYIPYTYSLSFNFVI